MITNKEIDELLDEYGAEEHYTDYCSNCGQEINGQVILKKDVRKLIKEIKKT